jgi:hypothetical protein
MPLNIFVGTPHTAGVSIPDESSKSVVDKLKNDLLPTAKEQLAKVASASGSKYPDSIAKEVTWNADHRYRICLKHGWSGLSPTWCQASPAVIAPLLALQVCVATRFGSTTAESVS